MGNDTYRGIFLNVRECIQDSQNFHPRLKHFFLQIQLEKCMIKGKKFGTLYEAKNRSGQKL